MAVAGPQSCSRRGQSGKYAVPPTTPVTTTEPDTVVGGSTGAGGPSRLNVTVDTSTPPWSSPWTPTIPTLAPGSRSAQLPFSQRVRGDVVKR
jgi:hypothetical protein